MNSWFEFRVSSFVSLLLIEKLTRDGIGCVEPFSVFQRPSGQLLCWGGEGKEKKKWAFFTIILLSSLRFSPAPFSYIVVFQFCFHFGYE